MDDLEKFAQLLDETYQWPADYIFKFIVPRAQTTLASNVLVGGKLTTKESRSGKYVSFTAHIECNSADEVIEIYKKMAIIPGVVSL
jgi:putative lipoic acid-binding regulatory protein